jgi:hypothetical protein
VKRILGGVALVTIIATSAVGATGAFFQDRESSSGNTFSAGSLTFKVDSTQHYNNAVCLNNVWVVNNPQLDQYPIAGQPCDGTWVETRLGLSNKFSNFTDLKPQDHGENTISIHNIDNPAWMCANLKLINNASTSAQGFDGNLANTIRIFSWRDEGTTTGAVPGDNIYQPVGGDTPIVGPETFAQLFGGVFNSPASTTIPIADSTTGGGPLPDDSTKYIGFAWCVGAMTIATSTNTIECDGSKLGNDIQSNSLSLDIELAEAQSRNNKNFVCPNSSPNNITDPRKVILQAGTDVNTHEQAGPITVTIDISNLTCRFCDFFSPEADVEAYITPWYPNDDPVPTSTPKILPQSFTLPPIGPWQSTPITWQGTVVAGHYYFVVEVDPNNLIGAKDVYRAEFFVD